MDAAEHPPGERKKHRHDLGQEDHGSKLAAGTTRAIQGLLGLWIALTLGLVVYALIDATRDATPNAMRATPSGAAPTAPVTR
jgi:hypothetical protein